MTTQSRTPALDLEAAEKIVFLKARWGEDEQLAKAATQGDWQVTETAQEEPDRAVVCIDHPTVPGAATGLFEADWGTLADAAHIARHDPARALREVAYNLEVMDDFPHNTGGLSMLNEATLAFRVKSPQIATAQQAFADLAAEPVTVKEA